MWAGLSHHSCLSSRYRFLTVLTPILPLGQREPRQCSLLIPASSSALYVISWGSQSPLPLALPCLPLTGSASPCRAVSVLGGGGSVRDLGLG